MKNISGKYDPKKDLGDALRLLNMVLEKNEKMVQHLDSQINILIGLSSAVFIFSTSRVLNSAEPTPFIFLATFSALGALCGLFAVHPPKFMRKRGQTESLMYNKKITEFGSAEGYKKELSSLIGDQKAIVEQYANEIFNLSTYYYRPKRELFKFSRNLLLLGVLMSVALLLWQVVF